jgi:hypothetical protein
LHSFSSQEYATLDFKYDDGASKNSSVVGVSFSYCQNYGIKGEGLDGLLLDKSVFHNNYRSTVYLKVRVEMMMMIMMMTMMMMMMMMMMG